jgi:hypothetical protein
LAAARNASTRKKAAHPCRSKWSTEYKRLDEAPDFETAALFAARDLVHQARKIRERGIEELVKKSPGMCKFERSVHGVGHKLIGLLIAELGSAGDDHTPILFQPLNNKQDRRDQESDARKRMGVALVNGIRQHRTTDKDLAEAFGYNPKRRSLLWNIGDCLIKHGKRIDSKYYRMYSERKAFELTRVNGSKAPLLHAHRRRFLRHLLAAWNQDRPMRRMRFAESVV